MRRRAERGVQLSVKSVLSGLLAVGLLAGAGYAVATFLDDRPAFPMTSDCEVTGEATVRLEAEQMGHAATIAAVGLRRGMPERAVTVALATALQESKLRNLSTGDRDSVGLFQQRPSQGWGSPEQLNDPRYAAGAFYDHLVQIPGWQEMRITEAAQAVQKSAHPEAYQKWAEEAGVLAAGLAGDSPAVVACRFSGQPAAASSLTSLREGIQLDWGDVATGEARRGGVALSVGDQRSGWQLAHWLVAHSAEYGISEVQFRGRQWTAEDGTWRRTDSPDTTVTVQFYGEQG
jgi:hypothetical protein